VSTHAIDVDKASILPQNCCVSKCTKKIYVDGGEKIFLPRVSGPGFAAVRNFGLSRGTLGFAVLQCWPYFSAVNETKKLRCCGDVKFCDMRCLCCFACDVR